MKLLFTGSRKLENNVSNLQRLKTEIENLKPRIIIHGGAKGADLMCEYLAQEMKIKTKIVKPDYKNHHYKAAPLIRNLEMIREADQVLAFTLNSNQTGGTWYTIKESRKIGKPVKILYQTEPLAPKSIQRKLLF